MGKKQTTTDKREKEVKRRKRSEGNSAKEHIAAQNAELEQIKCRAKILVELQTTGNCPTIRLQLF